jgi:hypothetical protein
MSTTIPFTEIATPRQVGARNDKRGCHFEALSSLLSLQGSLVPFVIARSGATKQSQLLLILGLRKADSTPLP